MRRVVAQHEPAPDERKVQSTLPGSGTARYCRRMFWSDFLFSLLNPVADRVVQPVAAARSSTRFIISKRKAATLPFTTLGRPNTYGPNPHEVPL